MSLQTSESALGAYLRDRRAKLDPTAFGLPLTRRRTPGLRREEVAQRAHVSATWYTWLEQGRGGAPSADVLERIAGALMLTDAEREHLFLLGLGRPPEVRYRADEGVSPRLQRVLDGFEISPAMIKSMTWDVLAWNRAASLMLMDYASMPPERRNILRIMFTDDRIARKSPEWEAMARLVVSTFRVDAVRAGDSAAPQIKALVDDLSAQSPAFAAMWRDIDVRHYSEGTKRLHPAGSAPISMEFSAFAVDGRPDLTMIVYNPASDADAARARAVVERSR
ncbi:MAG: helix-turn-helix transcriptional regulator [Terricaulis sp.]